jgi:SsrA-binding protein
MKITENKNLLHDYFIEERYEAGLMLQGWEVKAIRANRVQLREAYVIARDGALYLFGAQIRALESTSSFDHPQSRRTIKLLLNAAEIDRLTGKVERAGLTIVALDLHWKGPHVKCQIALARGKKQYDKRNVEKDRDWMREHQRIMKINRR